jgi:predicted amidohydrolase YtcJ
MGLGFNALQLDLATRAAWKKRRRRSPPLPPANPTPRWIIGTRLEPGALGPRPLPTAADIDKVVPGRPVWLERSTAMPAGRIPRR